MTPQARYQQDATDGLIEFDPAQQPTLAALNVLYEQLTKSAAAKPALTAWLPPDFLWRLRRKPQPPVTSGLYLWGGVGRGKTYLMDIFYESLPFDEKMRTHFHRFMQRVHTDLTALKGNRNPLELVAANIAKEARVVCFDEFFVSDIGDAMILGGLLRSLFVREVVLVATSNIPPRDLYENGLQRDRFLPAIDLLQQHTRVIELGGETDYRLRRLEQADLYHCPVDGHTDRRLLESFYGLAPNRSESVRDETIDILGRPLKTRFCADDVVWFDFDELCGGPRSAYDYVELARIYHAVLISGIPAMGPASDDSARRFVNLVDEFYDRNVKLIVSAEVPLDQLYSGTRLAFVFERTRSRLREMQSHDYLTRQHRA
ncbi:MAG: cell division protein ZapE [Pseudohongiellaceae bacterium]